MSSIRFANICTLICALSSLHCRSFESRETVKLWTAHEIILQAEDSYENPYKEVICWVTLKGLSFERRVYGFWDGSETFKVRVVAPPHRVSGCGPAARTWKISV